MNRHSLRIAFLVRAYPTISETFVRDQIAGLRDRGHSVDVYSLYVGSPPPGRKGLVPDRWTGAGNGPQYLIGPERSLPVALGRAAHRLAASLRYASTLAHLCTMTLRHPRIVAEAIHALPVLRDSGERTERHYDIVHAHFGPTGTLALVLRRAGLLTGPLVTTFHGIDLSRYPHRRGPDCYRWLFARGEAFTVNSRFSASRALALGAPPDLLYRLPMGISVEDVAYHVRTAPRSGPVRLLSVGRLEEVKGFCFGLRAVRLLLDRGFDVRYSIVGSGRLGGALRAEAADLHLDDVVRFVGPLPYEDVLEEYGRHHLFLMPGIETSDRQAETQGRVLVEAQAAGLPVVASRVGGIPETVASDAGLLVPPGDPSKLADAVAQLIDRPDAWEEMGRRGRRHAEAVYDQAPLVDRLVEIYRRIARGAEADEGTIPP